MKFQNTFIAPWALPNEVIPFHCVWEPENNLKKICFQLPSGYKLEETLNFSIYEFDNVERIISINIPDLKSNNYCGAVISYTDICDEVDRTDDICIKFFNINDEPIGKKILKTRVVRPKIQIEDIEKPLMIDDNTNLENFINLNVGHTGFGTANIEIKITEGGKNISKYNSLYFEMIEKMFEEISGVLNNVDEEYPEELGLDDDMMHKIADSFLDITSDKSNLFDLDPKYMESAKEILKNDAKREMAFRVILKNLSTIFLSALLYYNDRHPSDNVRLLYGNMAANIQGKIEEIVVTINYYDSQKNQYPPESTRIIVIDNRSSKEVKTVIEIPINIVWKKELLEL